MSMGRFAAGNCRKKRVSRQYKSIALSNVADTRSLLKFSSLAFRRAMTLRGSKPHDRPVARTMPRVYRLKYEEIEILFLLG